MSSLPSCETGEVTSQTQGSVLGFIMFKKRKNGLKILKVGTTHINLNCRTHKAHRELKFGTYANSDHLNELKHKKPN